MRANNKQPINVSKKSNLKLPLMKTLTKNFSAILNAPIMRLRESCLISAKRKISGFRLKHRKESRYSQKLNLKALVSNPKSKDSSKTILAVTSSSILTCNDCILRVTKYFSDKGEVVKLEYSDPDIDDANFFEIPHRVLYKKKTDKSDTSCLYLNTLPSGSSSSK